jgi:ubiquinone biosynthesis protein UbiJ
MARLTANTSHTPAKQRATQRVRRPSHTSPMDTPAGDPDAVVERLSTAAARLKALQAEAADVMTSLELPPSRTNATLARLDAATAALDPLRAEVAALRSRMDEVATELRIR